MNIRMCEDRDIPGILNIYQYYIEKTDITFECSIPSVEEFTDRVHRIMQRYPFLVAEDDGYMMGYAYADRFNWRAAYDWSSELSIYLKRGLTGLGTGTILYQELEKLLVSMNIRNLNACLTWPNPVSYSFHEKMGFQKTAHFEKSGYKFGRWIDVIWMQKILQPLPDVPDPVIWRNMAGKSKTLQ